MSAMAKPPTTPKPGTGDPAGPPDAPGRPDSGRLVTEEVLEDGLPEDEKRKERPGRPDAPAKR
jgi:hypothetical protein